MMRESKGMLNRRDAKTEDGVIQEDARIRGKPDSDDVSSRRFGLVLSGPNRLRYVDPVANQ